MFLGASPLLLLGPPCHAVVAGCSLSAHTLVLWRSGLVGLLCRSVPQFTLAVPPPFARHGAMAAALQTKRFKISSDGGCISQGFESSRLVLTAPGRGLGGKTNPHPAAASPPDVSGRVAGRVLVVVLPAKRIELL